MNDEFKVIPFIGILQPKNPEFNSKSLLHINPYYF